jgi:hypothetical protein
MITTMSDDLMAVATFGPDQPQRFLEAWLGPPSRDPVGPAACDLPAALAEWHKQTARWDVPVMRQNRVPAQRELDGGVLLVGVECQAVWLWGCAKTAITRRCGSAKTPPECRGLQPVKTWTSSSVTSPLSRQANGGRFNTLITSSVGRMVGQISTYEIDVPAGRKYVDVKFRTKDASADNGFTFYLVNPSGTLVATGTSPQVINGTAVAEADVYTADPVPGVWQIDVVLNLTTSGKEFTQTVHGDLKDPR